MGLVKFDFKSSISKLFEIVKFTLRINVNRIDPVGSILTTATACYARSCYHEIS